MNITKDDLTWMFSDPEWKNKFLIGSLLALAATFLPILGLAGLAIIYGYALILMRAEMRGQDRVLPKWQDYGRLFVEGLQSAASAFGYLLPGLVLFACSVGFIFFVGIFGAVFASALARDPDTERDLIFIGFILGQLAFMASLAVGTFLYLIGFIIVPVAVAQYARTSSIGSGYRWFEMWRIMRANASGFLVTWLVYWGISIGLSFALVILEYTIVLCLLVPFAAAPVRFYLVLLFAQFFGSAYREGAIKVGLLTATCTLTLSS